MDDEIFHENHEVYDENGEEQGECCDENGIENEVINGFNADACEQDLNEEVGR